jgi:hypothetical protein
MCCLEWIRCSVHKLNAMPRVRQVLRSRVYHQDGSEGTVVTFVSANSTSFVRPVDSSSDPPAFNWTETVLILPLRPALLYEFCSVYGECFTPCVLHRILFYVLVVLLTFPFMGPS